MHGRVKTITTEEQKLRQQKINDAKAKDYKEAMSQVIEKRANEEYDDEALTITREILINNPDVITLWNYRREIYLLRLKTLSEEELGKILTSELSLIETCLRNQPKSYGTWHHRIWMLDNFPTSDWNKELLLCNKYLSLDERNFHCWNYRQLAVERAQVPVLDEYNFTTAKIESNFSNYSAWHYRSKLLPKLFEDPEGKFPIAEDKHQSELELVQNAAFTDPDDQSAWFYQRWLLGLRNPGASFICAQIKDDRVFIALTQVIRLSEENGLELWVDGEKLQVDWISVSGNNYSTMWSCLLPKEVEDAIIKLKKSDAVADEIIVTRKEPSKRPVSFAPVNSTELLKTLEDQRKSCEELLELEPDSKWTLLTAIFLMRSLNPSVYHSKILSSLETLKKVDPLRSGYYADLSSQIEIERILMQTGLEETINLSGKNLSSIYHPQYLMLAKKVDLSNNKLKNNDVTNLYSLMNCCDLTLSGNKITDAVLPQLARIKNVQL